ncbi:MAG: GDSL-type esterase/lipase family protein [bacterium]
MNSVVFSGRWDLRSPARAITVNSGSYLQARFSGASINAIFDLSLNKAPLPTIAWRIDEGDWQESEIAETVRLAGGLQRGSHTLWLMVRGIDEHQNRWTAPLIGSVTLIGLKLPEGGKMLKPPGLWKKPPLKIEFLGDSITEGVLVQAGGLGAGKTSWPWQTDALHSYPCRTAMLLKAAWRQVGFGATGLNHPGSGGALGALQTFNDFYQGCPRDDWQPDLVVINHGTNDANVPPDAYALLYARYLALVRQAYPKAKIAALRPFGGAQAESISQEVLKARAKGDRAVYYIDTTSWYSGPLHPGAAASIGLADKLVAALKSEVSGL